MDITVDKFGRIVIPREVREGLGLEPGTVLRIEERQDQILLKPLREGPWTKVEGGVLVFSGVATEDLVGILRKHREERLKGLASTRKRR